MLYLLIGTGWLAAIAVLVAICHTAARADALQEPVSAPAKRSDPSAAFGDGLTVWDGPSRAALDDRRSRRVAPTRTTRLRMVTHGVR
jgi:hypothetical protein